MHRTSTFFSFFQANIPIYAKQPTFPQPRSPLLPAEVLGRGGPPRPLRPLHRPPPRPVPRPRPHQHPGPSGPTQPLGHTPAPHGQTFSVDPASPGGSETGRDTPGPGYSRQGGGQLPTGRGTTRQKENSLVPLVRALE